MRTYPHSLTVACVGAAEDSASDPHQASSRADHRFATAMAVLHGKLRRPFGNSRGQRRCSKIALMVGFEHLMTDVETNFAARAGILDTYSGGSARPFPAL